MINTDRFPCVEVAPIAELHLWLEQNHARDEAVRLVTWRKSVPSKYITTDQVSARCN